MDKFIKNDNLVIKKINNDYLLETSNLTDVLQKRRRFYKRTIEFKDEEKSLRFLAYGDAYGEPFEKDGLRGKKFDIKSLPDKPMGKITDDTKMAAIALNYLDIEEEKGGDFFGKGVELKPYLKLDKIKKAYKKWAEEEGADDYMGGQTAEALFYDRFDEEGQGNGSLMRCIPYAVALNKSRMTLKDIDIAIAEEASITHINKEVHEVSSFFCRVAFKYRFEGESMKNTLWEVREDYRSRFDMSKFNDGYTAWIYNSAGIVYGALRQNLSLIEGFKYIVSKGGDTDTNCAIYGAIVGATSKEYIRFEHIDDMIRNTIKRYC